MNIYLLITAIIGLSSVALGSYGEHNLRPVTDPEMMRKFMVGLRYHQNYSIILLIISIATLANLDPAITAKLKILFLIFTIGLVCFCLSIYGLVILANKNFGWIAPIGGISLMLGWLYLAYIAIKA